MQGKEYLFSPNFSEFSGNNFFFCFQLIHFYFIVIFVCSLEMFWFFHDVVRRKKMCTCEEFKCLGQCDPNCQCGSKCCFILKCQPYTKSGCVFGHHKDCNKYKVCYCLELRCKKTHHKLCPCEERCACVIYKCPKECCPSRADACLFYQIELCWHCENLKRRSMSNYFQSKKCTCECDGESCEDYYDCGHCIFQCNTHERSGWNLKDWQKLRDPTIITEAPKEPPYYFEENGTQVTTCDMCQLQTKVLDRHERSCRICNVYVCKHPKCVYDFKQETTSEEYGSSGGYWAYTRYSCEKSH
jgi:hypothetical protein